VAIVNQWLWPRVAGALPQVATLVRAEWLFLLTDVAHLYTANPSVDPAAQPIYEVEDMADLQARCRLCTV
jgi:glutamate 5-kinase